MADKTDNMGCLKCSEVENAITHAIGTWTFYGPGGKQAFLHAVLRAHLDAAHRKQPEKHKVF